MAAIGAVAGFDVAAVHGYAAGLSQPSATALAGIGAITAGVLAYVNGQLSRELSAAQHRKDTERERERHHEDTLRARESSLRDRYTTIASQIGDQSHTIRLAGVYALIALADDWHRLHPETIERQNCIDLLISYIRRPPVAGKTLSGTESTVRATIMKAIAKRALLGEMDEPDLSWEHCDTSMSDAHLPGIAINWSLTGLNLVQADLQEVQISSHADLTGTRFAYADLTDAELSYCTAVEAVFTGANLELARFDHANLTSAFLHRAKLEQTSFTRANLTDTEISEMTAVNCDFKGAFLHQTKLWYTTFKGTDFDGADLTGADLRTATFVNCSFRGAIGLDVTRGSFDEATRTTIAGDPLFTRDEGDS
ncbi:pentapeptide repeat-containing protein [Nocardia asteroides]|uniref:pentapeptide repeat-containing protein n=1 Tax=Nocardia asteroides TaxID=1824 RepID=UPI0037CB933B